MTSLKRSGSQNPGIQSRNNNFSFLRLLFASAVILGHSPELVDGDRHREPLTLIFHTLSLGELAVDGFFLLSGFLIVQSWDHKPELSPFLIKRVLRIYPGYIVAVCVSAFVVGPLGSLVTSYFAQFNFPKFLLFLLILQGAYTSPVFAGQPYPVVNGPLWTISHEFRCYLLVAFLGSFGILRKRVVWLVLTISTLVLSLFPVQLEALTFRGSLFVFGGFPDLFRLVSLFFVGGCFYLFRDRVAYKRSLFIIAAIALPLCLFNPVTAQLGVAIVGAYLLFGTAFVTIPALESFKTSSDISYGVYLYGWPIQKTLLWYIPTLSPWILFPIALTMSALCGLLSWNLVERPFLLLKPKARHVHSLSNDVSSS